MTFKDLKKSEGKISGLVAFDRVVSRAARKLIKEFLFFAITLLAVFVLWAEGEPFIPLNIIYGLILLAITFWLIFFMIDCFFYSQYFKGTRTAIREWGTKRTIYDIPFEVIEIISNTQASDISGGLLASRTGNEIFRRLDVSLGKVQEFFNSSRNKTYADSVTFSEPLTLATYVANVFDADKSFSDFAASQGIERDELIGAASWVASIAERRKKARRFWGRDMLGRVRGVGKEWSQGETYLLEQFGTFVVPREGEIFFRKEIDELEQILARTNGANALLVAEETSELATIVSGLSGRIQDGIALPQLEHKKLLILDTTAIDGAAKAEGQFETLVIRLFNQAVNAGNIVLVIQNFPAFILSAKKRNVDLVEVLEPYLSSSAVQIIAFSVKDLYTEVIERNVELMSRFEKIFVEAENATVIVRALEDKIYSTERRSRLYFTYQSLVAITESASRYFSDDVVEDKALDIFDELVPRLVQKGVRKVTDEHVNELITLKTGIPTGAVTESERSRLLNLENILHERIVGQDVGIQAIAKAMRRSRTGIGDNERPLGSFLFLGPTGVGKTETAKTLAKVFFESEEKIERLDMSEFHSPDALPRLIGSIDTNTPGILSELVREHPYCVLLLDEFEKADTKVHDLFLQILDEGRFSDVRGKRVNARNLIIIATSNAGSDLIWDMAMEGKNPALNEDFIIEHLIKSHIFRAELLNRFDDIVVFHPLDIEHRSRIAKILLSELQVRLGQQGVNLNVTEELVEYVATQAQEKAFGARPLRRFIQEKIEENIARKLLEGKIKKGDRINISIDDLK